MHPSRWLILGPIFAALAAPAAVHAEAADSARAGLALAREVHAANEGFEGERSEVRLILIDAQGNETVRRMRMDVLDRRDGDRSRLEFQSPPDVKGTRVLTWSHTDRADDQWLFLPSVKRIKRISSRHRSGSFMGSEFAYEDLAGQEVERFTYRRLGTRELDGRKLELLERVPKDSHSGYSRQVVWVDRAVMNPRRVDFYDRKGQLLKTATFERYERYGRFWRVGRIAMTNHQTKKRSVLEWTQRRLPVSIDRDLFDSDELDS